MSDIEEIRYSIIKLKNAIKRLDEALSVDNVNFDIAIDGTIQRFEFTFELAWKTMKRVLSHEGIICNTPRECLKSAFRLGIIDNEDLWLSMLNDRNLVAHVYDEKIANEIYERIKKYFGAFKSLISVLENEYCQE